MTTDASVNPANTYTWGADGTLLNVSGGTTVNVVYDAFGQAVETRQGTGDYTDLIHLPMGGVRIMMDGANEFWARVPLPLGATALYGAEANDVAALNGYVHAKGLGSGELVTDPHYVGSRPPASFWPCWLRLGRYFKRS